MLCLSPDRSTVATVVKARERAANADNAFVALLGFVGLSGLVLYALGATAAMPLLLDLHLGAVLAFFLLTPYTKMAHGFYRLAALIRDAQQRKSL